MAVKNSMLTLSSAVLGRFIEYIEVETSGLSRCIIASSYFLEHDVSANELVIDKAAMVCGVIRAGALETHEETVANWVVEYLRQNDQRIVLRAPREQAILEAMDNGASLVLSESMRSVVIPRAIELAQATIKGGRVTARHMIMALIENPDAWMEVTPGMPAEALAELWHVLVAKFKRYPADRELSGAWPEPRIAMPAAAPQGADDSPASHESLPTLADQPAKVDSLGRQSFARVLAARLRAAHGEAATAGPAGAFMAHIHGPWGYGKSSVLNFLRSELERPSGGPGWLVVDFNAWKHQRLRPPWWSLISAVYAAALAAPKIRGNWKLRRIWWSWRLRADWLPILLVATVLGLLAFGVVKALGSGDAAIKVLTAVVTAAAGVYAYVRFLLFGSAKAADAYSELKTDPYQPVINLYCQLIEAIGHPVAIFIDDLDRCDSGYVVELIEGIQTLLRSQPVSYVVAADRKWICAAFEKKYADFSAPIGEPARPLGYLFLDKLFQISAALPGISSETRKDYWRMLLDGAPDAQAAAPLAEADAEAQVRGKGSIEALNQVIAGAPEAHRSALRAAAAIEITRPEHAEAIEHSLQPFADLLEANPRAMKRLVNAVGMAQARAFLEARDVPLDTLARWTMIELRWPLLADYFASDIDAIDGVGKDEADLDATGVPTILAAMMRDRSLNAIIGKVDARILDAERLRPLLA